MLVLGCILKPFLPCLALQNQIVSNVLVDLDLDLDQVAGPVIRVHMPK